MARADNLPALQASQTKRHAAMIERALEALERFARDGERLTYAGLARTAGVSRAWLYREPVVRQAVDRELSRLPTRSLREVVPTRQSDASKDARIRNLLEDNRRLREAVRTLRARLSELTAELREVHGTAWAPQ